MLELFKKKVFILPHILMQIFMLVWENEEYLP